jgi:hypothetical protein
MIVWGGYGGGYLNDGARYSPSGNSWTATTITGGPEARSAHTAVWTGSEMFVWGGVDSAGAFGNGARYSPSANSWTTMTAAGGPQGRSGHTSVWTSTGMNVWGGQSDDGSFRDDTFNYIPDCQISSFSTILRSGGNLVLSFPSLPGLTYTLWYSSTVASGTWTNTGLPALTGNGGLLSFTVSAAPPRGFFRVTAEP